MSLETAIQNLADSINAHAAALRGVSLPVATPGAGSKEPIKVSAAAKPVGKASPPPVASGRVSVPPAEAPKADPYEAAKIALLKFCAVKGKEPAVTILKEFKPDAVHLKDIAVEDLPKVAERFIAETTAK